MTEEWRTIPTFPGYEASSLGRIRPTKPRYTTGRGATIKPWVVEQNGRLAAYVSLHENKKRAKQLVHRLVALAFLGPPPEGKNDCCHGDHNSLNNVASNLRWDTHAANIQENYDRERERLASWEEAQGFGRYDGASHGAPF